MELFHFKRQRKLSLRFLAGYLLGVGIQKDTHDSIVDARTALQLFQVSMPDSVMQAPSGTAACHLHYLVPGPPRRMVLAVTSGAGTCAFTDEAVYQMCADIGRRSVPQVYEELNAEGRFQEKLLEMYRWGKVNGWDAAPSTMQ